MTEEIQEEIAEHDEQSDAPARDDEAIAREARERFSLLLDAESKIRTQALEDKRFAAGEQWPEGVKKARESDARPCLTINRIPQFKRQITNDIRQNRPAIKVSPVDDAADKDTAKILQGIIRHIENASDADVAYDRAAADAVEGGFGFFRIITEFCDPLSFDLEIRIKSVRNCFACGLDPAYQNPDGSDAEWGFAWDDIPLEKFRQLYPQAKAQGKEDFQLALGDKTPEWFQDNSVRIAEYFYKEYKDDVACLIVQTVLDEQGQPVQKKQTILKSELPAGVPLQIVAERPVQVPQVKWVKLYGCEVLEKTDWPGKYIPIIPVLGEELVIDGERVLEGVVRHAKDPMRMYNYFASSEAEAIALAPKAPYIVAAGQLEGFEKQWEAANNKNFAFLQYNQTALNGQPAPPPQRNAFEPAVMAISQARSLASEDLKATTGIYDAALGNRSNENSGIAIQRRAMQAQTSNFHFVDNLARSIRHAGRILVDLIPKVYDTERAIRILGEDGSEEIVKINQEFEHKGEVKAYALDRGKYDVTVSTGPSYETKRQESLQAMLDFTRSMPQQSALIADLLVRNMDFPQADEIAERLKKTLPPGIADDKEQGKIPPQVQAQMQQQQQMIDQLTQELHAHSEITQQKRLELESRERIEFAKINAQIEMKMAEIGSKEAVELLYHEVGAIKHRLEMLNFNQPIENQQEQQNPAGAAQMGAVPMAGDEQQQPTGGQSPGLNPMEQP